MAKITSLLYSSGVLMKERGKRGEIFAILLSKLGISSSTFLVVYIYIYIYIYIHFLCPNSI